MEKLSKEDRAVLDQYYVGIAAAMIHKGVIAYEDIPAKALEIASNMLKAKKKLLKEEF